MVVVDCPVCGCDGSERMLVLGSKLFPLNVSICPRCGFVFQNPRPDRDGWEQYYLSDYDLFHRPRPGESECDDGSSRKAAADVCERLRAFVELDLCRRVLDVGAGNGEVLLALKGLLPKESVLTAVEPAARCKDVLKRGGIEPVGDSVGEASPAHAGTMDLIVMRHVLEHVFNPATEMAAVTALMTDRAVLYVAVPNLFAFDGRVLDSLCFPHLSYFNEATLRGLCEASGLSVITIEAAGRELFAILGKKKRGDPTVVPGSRFSTDNYGITRAYVRGNTQRRRYLKRRLKRLVSYLIPTSLQRTIRLSARRRRCAKA